MSTLYLDHAATSYPKDPRVLRAMIDAMENVGVAPGRGSSRRSAAADLILEQARVRAARLFSVDTPERITFTFNATDALNLVIKGWLSPGDEVVATTMEHNSVLRPLRGLERRQGIRWTAVEADSEGFVPPAKVLEAVRESTRLVVMCHASNVTGTLQPVEEIGAELKRRPGRRLFLVDAAQTAGYRSLCGVAAVADAIVASGHKGPGGPLGTGMLWLRAGQEISPLREGGTGTASDQLDQPTKDPGSLEAGSLNLPGIAGLSEAMRIALEELGLEGIEAARLRATSRFLDRVGSIRHVGCFGPWSAERREPVFALRVDRHSTEEAGVILEQAFRIEQRAGLHCAPLAHRTLGTAPAGTLRLSFGSSPSDAEVDRAIEALSML